MSKHGVNVIVRCSGCYEQLGYEDTARTYDNTIIVEVVRYQQHHECRPEGAAMKHLKSEYDRRVRGKCPACERESLFLNANGYVTCAWLPCPQPDLVSDLLIAALAAMREEQR